MTERVTEHDLVGAAAAKTRRAPVFVLLMPPNCGKPAARDRPAIAATRLRPRTVSERLPQATSAELISELDAILPELRRRLDEYLERGADDIVAADEGFNFAGQVQPLLSELAEYALQVRERLLELQQARP
jgi:hypothetical protein